MDKNLFAAVVVTTIVIIFFSSPLYQNNFGGKQVPTPAVEHNTSTLPAKTDSMESVTTIVSDDTVSRSAVTKAEIPVSPAARKDSTASVPVAQIDPPAEQTILLENPKVKLTIDTRGGVITDALMKKYAGPTKDVKVQLVSTGETWYDGLIQDGAATMPFRDIVFTPENVSKTTLVLSARLSGDRAIRKEFALETDGFVVKAKTTIDGKWNDPVLRFSFHGPIHKTEAALKQIRIWPFSMFMPDEKNMYDKIVYKGQGDRTTSQNGSQKQKRIYSNEGIQKIQSKKSERGEDVFSGDLDWFGVVNKYFMFTAIPDEAKRWNTVSHFESTPDGQWFDFALEKRVSDGSMSMDIFIGPIEYQVLKSYDHDLTQVMDLSWKVLRPIAILFLWIFRKLHAFIPNWGLVLIVFSIIIKFVLYPLSKKSMDSMKKMTHLQPKITELREKHKNNPQKLQQATMALYKEHGVNPFGGCLPILLQMPVFFALYPVVGRAFELRQAMFIPGWIEDLSRPDPYYILPIAMGISMYFQSKPTMKDPQQKPMLYIMPVMMVVLFANFSAGLTLYWLMFNVLTWAQQSYHKS